MIQLEDVSTFKNAVESAETIFMSAHVGPDGDTLGSMMGLMHALPKAFPHLKAVDCVISGKMPEVFAFLPGVDRVRDVEEDKQLLTQYDLAICVDCGAADRLGPAKPYFLNAKQSINIDHHISNSRFGKINIIDTEAGASGEVVADLLMGNDIPIPSAAATCLYTAILTDTGGFKYSSTSPKIFDMVATLTRLGANPEDIYRHIYEEAPKAQILLHAAAVTQAKFNATNTLCWSTVTQDMLREFGATEDHIEGLVETLRRINTVLIAAMFKETKHGHTKISLRSDSPFINVADVTACWGGGGHKMAAGCTIEKSPAEAEKELIPILEACIEATRGLTTA